MEAILGLLVGCAAFRQEGECGGIPYSEDHGATKAISIELDGRIPIYKDLHICNSFEEEILGVLDSYDQWKIPEARGLFGKRARGPIDWARTKGIGPDPKGYFRISDLSLDVPRRAGC